MNLVQVDSCGALVTDLQSACLKPNSTVPHSLSGRYCFREVLSQQWLYVCVHIYMIILRIHFHRDQVVTLVKIHLCRNSFLIIINQENIDILKNIISTQVYSVCQGGKRTCSSWFSNVRIWYFSLCCTTGTVVRVRETVTSIFGYCKISTLLLKCPRQRESTHLHTNYSWLLWNTTFPPSH